MQSGLLRRAALALLMLLALVPAAWAHASLIAAEPADGVTVAEPPAVLKLTFNEPVTPLVMRLIGPSGEASNPAVVAGNATLTLTAPQLARGTHVLSWRVISADGHPVSGSVVFSVGAPSAGGAVADIESDVGVRDAIWAAKIALYLGLLCGLGGAAFGALVAREALPKRSYKWVMLALALGLVGAALSLGLQGLDALALPLRDVWRGQVWSAGFATSFGPTALLAAVAMALAIVVMRMSPGWLAIVLAVGALWIAGVALAISGHAGTAEPRGWSRTSVFAHVISVSLWIGALIPLAGVVMAGPGRSRALARFSRFIPYALALLIASGLFLVYVQLDRLDALWTTGYGIVLSVKLAAVLALLALGAANRYWLVPRFEARGAAGARPLLTSLRTELGLAVAILAVVALWRFTPPPRALAAGQEVSVHFHGTQAMTQIEFEPVRARGAQVHVQVFDGEVRPLTVKEVTLVFSNPTAGIEPMRRDAISEGDSEWRIDDVRIPVAGRWQLRVELLISDFDKAVLEDQVELPRMP